MFAVNQFVLKVKLMFYFSDQFFSSGASTGGMAAGISIITILMLFCISVLAFFLLRQYKKTTMIPVVKEEDNPDYGTYYYADGDRRNDVMEVYFLMFK